MKSIRSFLIVATLATITLVCFMAALQGYQSGVSEAERLFDDGLEQVAQLTASLDQNDPDPLISSPHIAYQRWSQGQLLLKTRNAPQDPMAQLQPGFDYSNFEGYRWRTFVYPHQSDNDITVVAVRADQRFAMAEKVIVEAVVPIVAGLPVAALLIWLIVGQGLKQLRELAVLLRNKQPQDLSPIVLSASPVELEQVVNSVNSMLARLEDSFEREKRFASDAAHELRTPISALIVQLYNLEHELPEQSEGVAKLRMAVHRMSHLVEQMLALYRNTPEQLAANFTRLDLHALAQDVIATQYGWFEEKQQRIELNGSATLIKGNRFALETLLSNLLSNASKYTPQGGRVAVDVSMDQENRVQLLVEDSGPGIAEDQRQRIFERFYRVGGDRHASRQSGCGLGLSIVKNIIDSHGAKIRVEHSRFKTGAAFKVSFAALPATRKTVSG